MMRASLFLRSRRLPALGSLLLLLGATVAQADPLDDARAAWRRGDYELALELLRPLDDAGDSGAQATLALMYEFGQGVERSPARAAALYEEAAPGLDLEFRHNLATKFYAGDGLRRDYVKAARWWREAANGGLAASQYDLGLLYYTGKGVEQDYDEALRWYEAAARQGLARAEHGLGVLYATGRGVNQDYEEAGRWFRRAADRGMPKAQYNLGLMLLSGRGVERDEAQAEDLLRRAAAAGQEDALVKLAELRRERQAAEESATPAAPEGVRTARPASVIAPPMEQSETVPEPAPAMRTARPAPVPAQAPVAPTARAVDSFEQASPSAWTLQLASMSTAQSADEYADVLRDQLDGELYVVAYRAGDAVRYAVLFGVFADRRAAGDAAALVQPVLNGADPWARRVGAVQALLP